MNKRILTLAEQAGFMVDQSGHIAVCFTSDGDSEVKKFAELLIRECANIATNPYLNDEESYYGNEFAKAIKKHFGVEE